MDSIRGNAAKLNKHIKVPATCDTPMTLQHIKTNTHTHRSLAVKLKFDFI